jgi:hypothetical protein
MSIGEVRKCGHCRGSGTCGSPEHGGACEACINAAGGDEGKYVRYVACSACGGKGSVWVGPDIVRIPKQ